MKKGVVFPIPLLLLLNILTCGLFCWIYKTIISIKDFTGKVDINPSIEVLLGFLPAYFILNIGIINMLR